MRKITSIVLVVAFVILSVSGLQMAGVHKSENVHHQLSADHSGDKSMARERMPFYPKKAHEWAGYLFIGAGLVHIVLNKKTMLSYLRSEKDSK